MRRHRTYSPVQAHTSTLCKDTIMELQTHMPTCRATRGSAVVSRIALGTGMAVLLALLSGWAVPSIPDTAEGDRAAEPALAQILSPSELEDAGLAPMFFEDFFAHF